MERRRKCELRELNARAWRGENDVFPVASSLDSALKKNLAFVKRLRTGITASGLAPFIQEIRTLSLEKYLSEIISATFEGLCKLKLPQDVSAGVEVVSALHQRFGPADFTSLLSWHLGRALSIPDRSQIKSLSPELREKEEKERLSRHKVLLRVMTELWLVGVIRTLEDAVKPADIKIPVAQNSNGTATNGRNRVSTPLSKPILDVQNEAFPVEVLKEILNFDRDHSYLAIVAGHVKYFAFDLFGINIPATETPAQVTRLEDEIDEETPENFEDTLETAANHGVRAGNEVEVPSQSQLVDVKLQERFRNLVIRYTEDGKRRLLRDHDSFIVQGRRNAEAYVKSGEVFEDRQANYEKQSKALEKMTTNLQGLCDALGLTMPTLESSENLGATNVDQIGLVKTGDALRARGDGAGIWEDEEERRFYENLVDVKDRVPGILLEETKKKKTDNDEQVGRRNDEKSAGINKEASDVELEDQLSASANRVIGSQVDSLLAKLPELQNKDAVDQLAIDFCFINSKASRNRLIKALQTVPKGRQDLLPLWSRLIVTLGKYLSDVLSAMVSYLDDEFRSLQNRKGKDWLGQVRLGNIKYLAELVKFGVVPEHVIFHCFKVALDDFSRPNIELIANLLDNCGRYLHRRSESTTRMQTFLETLQRKKSAQHLGQQERLILENALYYVVPPERSPIQRKDRSPIELYLRKLVYVDLNKTTYITVLKQLRKLYWDDKDVAQTLEKIFSKPGKVKYGGIHLLAVLLQSLYRYRQSFVITIIDNTLENITLGLEHGDYKYNQKRIAEVKYLGEMYNYKLVDSPIIFDALFRILGFGYAGGLPELTAEGLLDPEKENPLDPSDDFFRIRLVCAILDTCGQCFDRGAAQKRMDFFLSYFEYYIHTKASRPHDIDFLVTETFNTIRSDWKRVGTLKEAAASFSELVAESYQPGDYENAHDGEENDDARSLGSEDEIESRALDAEDDQEHSDENSGAKIEGDISGSSSESFTDTDDEDGQETIVVTRNEPERDLEAEADFDRELAKLMSDSSESRKSDRRPLSEIPLPLRNRVKPETINTAEQDEPEAVPPKATGTMTFSLMTKRGTRQQTKAIELPSSSSFAVAMKNRQEVERAEQQRIKSLVLKYDMQDDNDGSFAHDHQENFDLRLLPPNHAGSRHNSHHTSRKQQPARKLQLSDVDWT